MSSIEGLRGAAIVSRAGSAELALADGPADAETGTACTPQTRFQIASISKQFAAVAVLLLAESGTVLLDEPVDRWFPGSPAQWQRVTLHHLLTHTAGVGHWGEAPGFEPSKPMDPGERLELVLQAPLVAEPGTRWRYSSPGFLLAGHIVRLACGQPYARFVTERIVAPLGLTSTTVGGRTDGIARGYSGGQPVATWDLSTMPGTGDICSTVGDLARFTTLVQSGALLTGDSLRAMRTVHTPVSGDQGTSDGWLTVEGYGYGCFVGRIAGCAAYVHSGDNPGYQSFAAWLPEPAASIVILANDEAADLERLLRQLVPAALESAGQVVSAVSSSGVRPRRWDR
ncbi:MAG: serine hydrolase domain-containing protein [Streptosporangiaceae bacterium]|jgi:CubicO group peptidase (beta-lactamase class C family)